MNLTPHSEELLCLITYLCRSDTSLGFVESGSSKIKSYWKTYACSEISIIFYKWQGEQTESQACLGHCMPNPSGSLNSYFSISPDFGGQSDINFNV